MDGDADLVPSGDCQAVRLATVQMAIREVDEVVKTDPATV
jgi:hypothetical protein